MVFGFNSSIISVLRSLTLALAIIAASVSVGYAANVVVEGNSRVETTTILSYVQDQAPEAAKRDLMATGLFSSVDVTMRGETLVVRVKENDVINRVAFEGNKKLKSDVFESELQLKPRGAFSQSALDADIAVIKEIYQRVGRSNAQVTARTVQLPNGKIDVVFTVDEGAKTGIEDIVFVGNKAFSSGTLRDQMQTTRSNWLSWIKTSDIYDPDRLASDLESVRRYYLRHGYADAQITDSKVEFDSAEGGFVITISVSEGIQYRVGAIAIESKLADVPGDELQSSLRISKGDIYNADLVDRSIFGLTKTVASRGYAFSQVRPQGDRNPETATIDLKFFVEEGPRVYIERINVRGNTRTRDYVIRREFDIGEGDAYNKVLIDRTERRLNNLGYFKVVRITNEPGSAPDRVIVNVDVEDQSTGQFSIAGGYSTTEGFIGEVGIRESNLLGSGRIASIKGSTGQYSRGLEFNYTEPYIFDRRMAAGFDIYSKQSDNARFARYSNMMTGGTVRISAPVTEEFSVSSRYSLFLQDISIPNSDKQFFNNCVATDYTTGYVIGGPNPCFDDGEASLAIKDAQGERWTSLVGYTLIYNTLDSVRDPRSGFYSEFKQDFAGLGGDSNYIKTTFDSKYYYEFNDSFVGMLRGQAGYIYGVDYINDNFFMGSNLVRGFANAGIGPRDITINESSYYSRTPLGGSTYVGTSAELQFPVFGLPREAGLRGAVFADAGTLFGYDGPKEVDGVTLEFSDEEVIRSSAGFGVLWASPLGPIRLDFAWPITKGEYDQTQLFRFSGGTAF